MLLDLRTTISVWELKLEEDVAVVKLTQYIQNRCLSKLKQNDSPYLLPVTQQGNPTILTPQFLSGKYRL